mgnify:CR=1 FL=1
MNISAHIDTYASDGIGKVMNLPIIECVGVTSLTTGNYDEIIASEGQTVAVGAVLAQPAHLAEARDPYRYTACVAGRCFVMSPTIRVMSMMLPGSGRPAAVPTS